MAGSHYETLGVADGARPDDVRRAYLEHARRLHPDRWIDASPAERSDVERRMQEVNEAWRVLGNAGRRLAYDAGRRQAARPQAAPARPFPSGDLFVDEAPSDLATRVVRALPWALVLAALAGIFVFTAYATSGDEPPASCVQRDGSAAVPVPCDADGAREIVLRVTEVGHCPTGTEPFQPSGAAQALCLAT